FRGINALIPVGRRTLRMASVLPRTILWTLQPVFSLSEDESITALHLAQQLRSLGYQVVALAHSGLRAIEHALAHRPHAVLMDIHLQGTMDGIDAARHIQAATPIPVVYMGAHADAATIKRLQATTQAAGFMPKPIHLPTLHATLQRACSRPQGDLS
ncbi:MAG TPA: response regulator, partial [Gammaproteobacteria bacterium]|nr:response regulator [Gammaproteobacteria bacterium]